MKRRSIGENISGLNGLMFTNLFCPDCDFDLVIRFSAIQEFNETSKYITFTSGHR